MLTLAVVVEGVIVLAVPATLTADPTSLPR